MKTPVTPATASVSPAKAGGQDGRLDSGVRRNDVGEGPPDGAGGRHQGLRRLLALAVHGYTAAGAVLALLATLSVMVGDHRSALLWLYAAVVVDATDGWLARRVGVCEALPSLDGRRLDDVVDYVTFAFVPALVLVASGRLPPGWGVGVAGGMLVASAYGFARVDAKSDDDFFTGFPSYWNIVAFYLFAFEWPPVVNAALLVALSGMVFVPVGYVYPSRTRVLRGLTVGAGAIWALVVLVVIVRLPRASDGLLIGSLLYPAYYVALSMWLQSRRRRGPLTA